MNTDTAALAEARRRRAALEGAMRELIDAVAAPMRAPNWRTRVATAADDLRIAVSDHVAAVEGNDGLLVEVEEAAPRLSVETNSMRDDHRILVKQLDELTTLAHSGTQTDDLSVELEMRRAGTETIRLLEDHRQRGSDLVYEAYAVDIGGQS